MRLTSPQTIKYIMDKYGFRFSKSLGQNFLIDDFIVDEIIDGAEIGPDDVVLEVGPGIGVMTQAMARRAKKVVAIEIDNSLLPVLSETLAEEDNVEVVNGDVLKVDLQKIIDEKLDGQAPKVVANLPYYVTTPIIMRFLEEQIPVTDIVVMVQKEVADRMVADPGGKIYGALSVVVQYYAEPSKVVKVPRSVFMPQPNVESSVVRLKKRKEPPVDLKAPELFFKTVRSAFMKRRKTLLNALSSGELAVSKEETKTVLEACGIDPKRRGETLDMNEFAALANGFYDIKNN
ncbi:16S rRNA (adenine(1518)-N(6)/adenine(1519)-N(6))-dimethyltransferase RsmA [Fusibacter sp. JL216-2]|uniref:16S rRNA (adenine(1518)-N(6)/adenine(1519)-N(6))- dimethyltransferase RsmA n=1 Tax=Fusibacter sp. JL216-2 TaxID=3071453 RepID=UPI003D32E8B1